MIRQPNVFLAVVVGIAAVSIAASPTDQVAERARAQQQTKWMAEQLVAGILDIQIQQLEENGLQHLPVYVDILAMRANLSRMSEQQMRAVTASLAEAQGAAEPRRTELLQSARQQARDVVRVLLAERDRLRRRMRVARLAAELQQLILMQSGTLNKTRELENVEAGQRDRALLSVMEDQRDNYVVFGQLLASLDVVSTWGGQTGAGALACLQVLTGQNVDGRYTSSEQLLASNQLAGAMEAQQQIILDLRAALQRLREALGVDETHPYAKSLQARELAEQQRQLRQETERADLNETTVADQLSQQQKDIHQEIAALKEGLADLPRQRQLADEAQQAAYEAESHLFQADRQAALGKQQRAIERLEQLAESLDGSDQVDRASASEQAVESEWGQLQQLDRELAALDEQQSQVLRQAPNEPAAARQLEQQVASGLEQAAGRQPLSPAVRQSVQAAAATALDAAETLKDASPAGRQERTAAAREAKQALQRARELTQARLEELAQSSPPAAADMVQAAENLERVARVEQDLAEVASSGQLDRQRMNQQIEAQTQAARTVHDVAEQVQQSAPAVSSQLGRIETSMQQLGQSLQSMQGAEQIPAPQATAVAEGASKTASELLQMASQLRQQVAGSEADGQSSSQSAEAQPSQMAQNQGTPAESQSQTSRESQPSETNQTAPSESGNRLTRDQGRVREGTVTEDRRSLQDSPWFAKLPPALRESIRARTRRRAPRGYEERLRRYFESVDKR